MRMRYSKPPVNLSRPSALGIAAPISMLIFLLNMLAAPLAAASSDFCGGCELSLGIGDTYHYWGTDGRTGASRNANLRSGSV